MGECRGAGGEVLDCWCRLIWRTARYGLRWKSYHTKSKRQDKRKINYIDVNCSRETKSMGISMSISLVVCEIPKGERRRNRRRNGRAHCSHLIVAAHHIESHGWHHDIDSFHRPLNQPMCCRCGDTRSVCCPFSVLCECLWVKIPLSFSYIEQ